MRSYERRKRIDTKQKQKVSHLWQVREQRRNERRKSREIKKKNQSPFTKSLVKMRKLRKKITRFNGSSVLNAIFLKVLSDWVWNSSHLCCRLMLKNLTLLFGYHVSTSEYHIEEHSKLTKISTTFGNFILPLWNIFGGSLWYCPNFETASWTLNIINISHDHIFVF